MGLISSLKSVVSKAVSSVSTAASAVKTAVSKVIAPTPPSPPSKPATVSKPATATQKAASSVASAVVKTVSNLPGPVNLAKTTVSAVQKPKETATAVATLSTLAIPGVSTAAVAALSKLGIGTKLLLGGATIAGASYVASGGKKAGETLAKVANIPGNLIDLGKTTAQLEKGTLGFSSYLSENKEILGGAAAAAALIGGSKLIAPVVAASLLKDKPADINIPEMPQIPASVVIPTETPKIISTNNAVPTTPATQEVKPLSKIQEIKTRRSYTRTKTKPQNISQRVNINFDQDVYDYKKYLNRKKL